MHVLITGGAGFLGSALARSLLQQGHEVTAFDADFARDRLPQQQGLHLVRGDIRDEALVDDLVAASDRVLHMAAIAGVHIYMQRPLDVLDVNVLGTRNLLMACHRHDRPVVIASSSEAYGKNPLELSEDGDTWLGPTTNGRWCYGTSKVVGEHYAWALARQGLRVAAVRYFNAYGPLLDAPGEGRVISQFLGAVRDGRPIQLVDGGAAVRSFCFVDDAVDATLGILQALPDSSVAGRPFNIGRAEPVTMRQLADQVIRLSGHAHGTEDISGAQFFGEGFEEIPHRTPDVSAIHRAIGWTSAIGLDEGLRRTLEWWGLLRADPPAMTALVPNIRPQYDADGALLTAYAMSLVTGRTTNGGPQVRALEAEASAFLGVPGVLAVHSGADALNLAVRAIDAAGVAILPAFTYVSTLNAVELAGLRPVFCDIDPSTWTMDPGHLADLLSRHPDCACVLPVNVYGIPPDLGALCALARRHGARVIHDNAHGFGTEVGGQRHDALPDITTFSLHATKVVPSIEGGLLTASDPALLDRLIRLRTHGIAPDPAGHLPGYNAKMDELSAATARHSLARVHGTLRRRRDNVHALNQALTAAGWAVQAVPAGVLPNGQNLCARSPLGAPPTIAALLEHGVEARRYFDPPLHHLDRHRGRHELPVTDAVWSQLVCLPLHTRMSPEQVAQVAAAIRSVTRSVTAASPWAS